MVLKADQTEAARKELLDSVEKKLKTENSKLKTDLWGGRDLAYPIKHLTRGFYAHFEFSAEPSLAADLDKTLRVEEDIIRYLLVRDEGKIRKVVKPEQNLEKISEKEKKESAGRPGRKIISRRSETVESSK